jgi:hypothetical protein
MTATLSILWYHTLPTPVFSKLSNTITQLFAPMSCLKYVNSWLCIPVCAHLISAPMRSTCPCPFHNLWFDQPNNIWRQVQKLLIIHVFIYLCTYVLSRSLRAQRRRCARHKAGSVHIVMFRWTWHVIFKSACSMFCPHRYVSLNLARYLYKCL